EMQSFDDNVTLSRHPMPGLSDTKTLDEVYNLLLPKRSGEVFIYQDTPDNVVGVVSWSNLQQEIRSGQV
ncbi:MAG: chloride channel protein, partial [Shewanella sp.]